MTFVDNVISTATEVFETTARKSVYLAQIAKYNIKISAENNSLKELYAKLGKAYFDGIESGESESALFAKALCENIVAIRGRIDAMNAEIERLKAEDRAAKEASAAARAAKEAAAGAAEPTDGDVDGDVEITIEVKDTAANAEQTEDQPAQQPEAYQPPEPPIVNLYVDASQDNPHRE